MRSRGSVVKYALENFLYILVENDLGRKISSVHEAISIVESKRSFKLDLKEKRKIQ